MSAILDSIHRALLIWHKHRSHGRAVQTLPGIKGNIRGIDPSGWNAREAVDYAVKATPRGWIKPDGRTIWGDIGLYLRQPGYGTSYVYGKIQLERLIADIAQQKGEDFRLQDFFDDYFSRGVIPASLLRWEMTGLDNACIKMRLLE